MSYGKYINNLAEERLSKIRNANLDKQEMEQDKLYNLFPRLKEIEAELRHIGAMAGKAVLAGTDARTVTEQLALRSSALQNERKVILLSNGYKSDALEPHFTCEKCRDTGRIENEKGITVLCECLKNIRMQIACEELNKVSPLSLSTFESFRLDCYDMDVVPGTSTSDYDRMSKILEYCKKYAENFSAESDGIIMKGATGLGKTHLSLAIANEIIKKGFGVIYVSAPDILAKLERFHFNYDYDEEEQIVTTLTECDLLIIDDLGTEFQSNYNTSAIYNIFNSRLLKKHPTIINTNLTLKELEKYYTQRFVSRIMGNFVKMDFRGSDFRRPNKR